MAEIEGNPRLLDGWHTHDRDSSGIDLAEAVVGKRVTDWATEDHDGQGRLIALAFEDGTRVVFAGWGHDWWGTDAVIIPPPDPRSWRLAAKVRCPSCGEERDVKPADSRDERCGGYYCEGGAGPRHDPTMMVPAEQHLRTYWCDARKPAIPIAYCPEPSGYVTGVCGICERPLEEHRQEVRVDQRVRGYARKTITQADFDAAGS